MFVNGTGTFTGEKFRLKPHNRGCKS